MGNMFGIKSSNLTLSKFVKIEDEFLTTEHLNYALHQAGIESCNLIFAIDYTSSNKEAGAISFNGLSLHNISSTFLNPYQHVIQLCGSTLESFDEDKLIPAYGFGDIRVKNKKVFNINKNKNSCYTFNEVLKCYNEITPQINMNGPTSFYPIIKQAIEIVRSTGCYHMLVIITDGQIIDKKETASAIVEASKYPLSIISVGVGDGPFDEMEKYDDELPTRKFDNFQFVNYEKVMKKCRTKNLPFDSMFMLEAMQEIPQQYSYLKNNGMLSINTVPMSYEYELL